MKRLVLLGMLLFAFPMFLIAQVQLTFSGSAADGTIIAGEVLSWQISSIPPGSVSHNELWLDVNNNGALDVGTDVLIFMFDQVDGGSNYDGPGDDDGAPNGIITTSFPAGLAPAHWILVVKTESGNSSAALNITPLASPAATITGTVSVPAGYPKANFVVEASTESESAGVMNPFWHALTDINGNFTIAIGTVGGDPVSLNPWRVGLAEGGTGWGRLVPIKKDTTVNLGGVAPVVSLMLIQGTVLTGTVRGESAQPLPGADVWTELEAGYGGYGTRTDGNGTFAFAVPPGNYRLNYRAEGYFHEYWDNTRDWNAATILTITTQDSVKNLNADLTRGAVIRGQVRNYGMPVRAQIVVLGSDYSEMVYEETSDNGSWSVTVDPGSYYVKFDYQGNIQYYDHQSSLPADLITITGTETVDYVDADFTVGTPPLPPPPQILAVWDVPFDNGRHVYVKWLGIDRMFAAMNNFGVESYSIWRQDGPNRVFMQSIPAAMDSVYTAIVQTLRDSTKTEGMFTSTYIVRAHFIFNAFVLTSDPEQGYSLDNMAPGVPAGIGSVVSGADVVVRWSPNEDEDFKYYSVYRSTTPGFSVEGLTPYAFTTTTEYVDAGGASGTFYYRLTATDHAGNQSEASVIVSSSGTTAAEPVGGLPVTFALHGNYPNPFNPTTTIAFDLPARVQVSILIYNTLGEQVASVLSAERSAGSHTVVFDASALPSGLYFCRMQAGEFSAVQKMSLIK